MLIRNVLSNYTDMYASMAHPRFLLKNYRNIRLEQTEISSHIGATTIGTGVMVPPTFRLGTNNELVPNFLAVVFKKQEISQQAVTRMQDLAFEFSKKFPGVIPQHLTARGGTPPVPNTQPGL